MKKTELKKEFNNIKKEFKFLLKGYSLHFDYGYVSFELPDVIGHTNKKEKKIYLNENDINRDDIKDVLIHEMAHACIFNTHSNVDNHGNEWYKFYKLLGGEGDENYADYWKNNGLTIYENNKIEIN